MEQEKKYFYIYDAMERKISTWYGETKEGYIEAVNELLKTDFENEKDATEALQKTTYVKEEISKELYDFLAEEGQKIFQKEPDENDNIEYFEEETTKRIMDFQIYKDYDIYDHNEGQKIGEFLAGKQGLAKWIGNKGYALDGNETKTIESFEKMIEAYKKMGYEPVEI